MHSWQTLLRFGDAHPWFLPSVAAIFILLTAAYKSAAWARQMIRSRWERWEDNLVAGYLTQQVNPGPFELDTYGHIRRVQKDCSVIQIADALKLKPVKVRAAIERLERQERVRERAKSDMWSATPYQTRQPTGRWVKMWLDHLDRKKVRTSPARSHRKQG